MKKIIVLLISVVAGVFCVLNTLNKGQTLNQVEPIETANTQNTAKAESFVDSYQVTEIDLPQEVLDFEESFSDLEYSEFIVNKIPVLQVTKKAKNEQDKLAVFLHGVTSCKENEAYLLSLIAETGCTAISIDMPGHGMREDGPYMFLDVITVGAQNLNEILHYYEDELEYDLSNFSLLGFSAGGICAYQYALTQDYLPSNMVICSAIADWEIIRNSKLLDQCYDHSQYVPAIVSHDSVLDKLDSENPYSNLTRLKETKILISHGLLDQTIPYEGAEWVVEDLKQLGNSHVELIEYSETNHEIPSNFLNIMVQFLINSES